MSKVRVPVAGTVGKSIRVDRESTAGATIGTDLRLPNGSVPSLSQLAAALGVNQGARQSSLSNTIWKLIREVPEVLASVGDLTDPNEDAIFYWDDVNGIADWMTEIPDSFLSANVALYDGSVAQFSAGTFLNARISETNVTQHEAAIDHDALTNFVEAKHIDWTITGAEDIHVDRITQAAVTQHQAALTITESQISDLTHYTDADANAAIDARVDQPFVAALGFYTETEIDAFGFLTSVLASDVDSGAATDGFVLTADGAGGAAWEAAAGGVTDHGALTGLTDDDHPQYARLAAANTFTGGDFATPGILLSADQPYFGINETDAGTDEKNWRIGGSAGSLNIFTRNDALNAGNTAVSIQRSSTTVTEIELNATTLDFNGAVDISGNTVIHGGNGLRLQADSHPRLYFDDTNGATDEQVYDVIASQGTLFFRLVNDAESAVTTWLSVQRTGTTVDEIELNATTLDFNGNVDISGTLDVGASGAEISGVTTVGLTRIRERAAASSDIAGRGQLWVRDDTPNTLWFTDDAGNDHQMFHYLTAGYKGGGRITVSSTAPGSPVQGDIWFDTS